jgi:hypothetical protein
MQHAAVVFMLHCRLAAEAGVQSETATFADCEHYSLVAVKYMQLEQEMLCLFVARRLAAEAGVHINTCSFVEHAL